MPLAPLRLIHRRKTNVTNARRLKRGILSITLDTGFAIHRRGRPIDSIRGTLLIESSRGQTTRLVIRLLGRLGGIVGTPRISAHLQLVGSKWLNTSHRSRNGLGALRLATKRTNISFPISMFPNTRTRLQRMITHLKRQSVPTNHRNSGITSNRTFGTRQLLGDGTSTRANALNGKLINSILPIRRGATNHKNSSANSRLHRNKFTTTVKTNSNRRLIISHRVGIL